MHRFIFFFAAILVLSCKKNNPPADTCKVSETTIPGTYLKTAVKYKASSSAAEEDWFSGLQECEKDDPYELKPGGTVVVGDGPTVCPGPPPPGTVTAWSLSADKKTLNLDAVYTILSFDCKTIVLQEKDSRVIGDIRTVTFVKQ